MKQCTLTFCGGGKVIRSGSYKDCMELESIIRRGTYRSGGKVKPVSLLIGRLWRMAKDRAEVNSKTGGALNE